MFEIACLYYCLKTIKLNAYRILKERVYNNYDSKLKKKIVIIQFFFFLKYSFY